MAGDDDAKENYLAVVFEDVTPDGSGAGSGGVGVGVGLVA